MKKRKAGGKFKRNTNQRKHLAQGLVADLVLHEQITTTYAKAKFAKRIAEKLVTKARTGTVAAGREIFAQLPNKQVAKKLMHDIGPRFKQSKGGYIRILKVGNRRGDNATLALLEWTIRPVQEVATPKKKKTKTKDKKVEK